MEGFEDPHVGTPEGRETVTRSAVIAADGTIFVGKRHRDCFDALHDAGKSEKIGQERIDAQGFITSRGRFVTREEAFALQTAAGIKSVRPDGYRNERLYSEDLY